MVRFTYPSNVSPHDFARIGNLGGTGADEFVVLGTSTQASDRLSVFSYSSTWTKGSTQSLLANAAYDWPLAMNVGTNYSILRPATLSAIFNLI